LCARTASGDNTVQRVGPDLVFGRLWESLGLGSLIQRALQSRRYEFDVERAIYLTLVYRLFASGSDRAAERWREAYRLPGTESIELHHQYRAMASLGEPLAGQPGPRAFDTPRCTNDWIEEELFEQRRDLFSEIDLVFFDTTSIYFEGEGGQEMGRHGKSKDHRRGRYVRQGRHPRRRARRPVDLGRPGRRRLHLPNHQQPANASGGSGAQ